MSDGPGGDLANDIKQEAQELVERLVHLCQTFQKNLMSNEEVSLEDVGELFRNLHTLKGLSQMGGLLETVAMAHAVEDYVELVRSEKVKLEKEIIELLFDAQHTFDEVYKSYPNTIDPDILMELDRLKLEFEEKAKAVKNGSTPAASQEITTSQEASGMATPQEANGVTISKEENESFNKFIPRSENICAVFFKNSEYKTVDELKAGTHADNISRVGDFILYRVIGEQALIVFAADLDVTTLNGVVGVDVTQLEKTPTAFSKFNAPWNEIKFDVTEAKPNVKATEDVKEVKEVKEVKAQEAVKSDPHGEEEAEEDFDTKNLSGESSFEKPDLDPEMLQDFLSNADELLENLSQSMLDLEGNPESKEAVESIFRSAHTIKGTSGMFGFRAIEKLTHKMENLFDRIRKGTLSVSPALMDGLFFGLDRIKSMFDAIKENKSSEQKINDALEKLRLGSLGVKSATPSAKPAEEKNPESKTPESKQNEVKPAVTAAPAEKKPADKDKKKADEKKGGEEAGGTIRVDLKRLDSLVNLVGELVIDRTRFARIEEELRVNGNSALGHLMSESVLLFSRHMNEVQSIIMKIRMVPVGNAFYKFTRVVRDLCRQIGKEIDLHIIGGETELDKTLVEEIADPLVHLIRNSVDHGVELPDDREKVGKPRKGNINLKASQDGNMIVITIQDDGKGLQVDRIKNKAIEKGIIKETDQLSNKEIFNLIFEAGFSTAEKVTNISGRGVGMDVVKKSIVKLKGIIELDSEIGKGTTTTIKLPLTLAIIPSLMVETKGESYAVPLVNVIESIRIRPDDIQKMGSADFVKLRDRVLPLLRLSDVFDLKLMEDLLWYKMSDIQRSSHDKVKTGEENSFRARHTKPRLIFVVVGVGEKRVGVVVEQLQGQQEIVIKSLGKLIGKQRGIAGGCVLGNGRVALVLDVGEIIDEFSQARLGGRSASV